MSVGEFGAECNTAVCRYSLFASQRVMRYSFVLTDAGWSSLAARRAHNPKVTGSNPVPATKFDRPGSHRSGPFRFWRLYWRAMTIRQNCPIIRAKGGFPAAHRHRCQLIKPLVLPAHRSPGAKEKFQKPATGSPASTLLFVPPAAPLKQALIFSCSPQPTGTTRIVDEYS